MQHNFEKSIVRIFSQDNKILGAGFLTISKQIVTCAHVVSSSVGLDHIPVNTPTHTVYLDFPFADPNRIYSAKISGWHAENDLAILELENEEPPYYANTSLLSKFRDISSHEFHVYGFPEGRDYGVWSFGKILGRNTRGVFQIESETTHVVRQGFSGSLVWDSTIQQIVGIIVETDSNVRETRTSFFLSVNSILECFPSLTSTPKSKELKIKYACFISYPNEIGVQGQLAREFAEAIYEALSVEIGGLFDRPIYFDKDHIRANSQIAEAICNSACLLMILTPKYFNEKSPLCAQEFKAMQNIESHRLGTIGIDAADFSFIIPVMPYSREVLPMNVVGQRKDYDFRDMVLSGNLRSHPLYGPQIRQLAEHIFRCSHLLENCEEDFFGQCAEYSLPNLEDVSELLNSTSPKKYLSFPNR